MEVYLMHPLLRLLTAAVIGYLGVKQTVEQVRQIMDVPPPKKPDPWNRYFPR
jgi:hypothetical protein